MMFIEAASKGRNDVWRYVIAVPVFCLVVGLDVLFLILATLVSVWVFKDAHGLIDALDLFAAGVQDPWRWGQPYSTADAMFFAAYLVSVFLLALGPVAAVRYLHKRPVRSLVVGDRGFRWGLFGRSFLIGLVGLGAGTAVEFVANGESYRITSDLGAFLTLAAIVLVLVPLQVLGEEVIFRGYILQSVAWFSRLPAVRLLVPAVLFFGIHLGGKEMSEGGPGFVTHYVIVSLYLTWLAMRTDGLEAGLGLHIAINYVAMSIVTDDARTVSLPALFFAAEPAMDALPLGALWLIAIHYWWVIRGRFPVDQTRTPVGTSGNPASSHNESS